MNNDEISKNRFKILVAYASQFGTTAEVAEAIGDILGQDGAEVETRWIKDVSNLESYDAVVIGSAIQYDRWMSEAAEFVKANQHVLNQVPVAYFFTCLTLSKRTEKTERQALAYADKLIALAPQVKPVDIGRFAGVLNYSKMPFYFRFMFWGFSLITGVQEGDYRDWEAIRAWANVMVSKLVDDRTRFFIPSSAIGF